MTTTMEFDFEPKPCRNCGKLCKSVEGYCNLYCLSVKQMTPEERAGISIAIAGYKALRAEEVAKAVPNG